MCLGQVHNGYTVTAMPNMNAPPPSHTGRITFLNNNYSAGGGIEGRAWGVEGGMSWFCVGSVVLRIYLAYAVN
jgi:hypothetical protein